MKRLLLIILAFFFIGSQGWAQQCSEDVQLAWLSPAMLGSVPAGSAPTYDVGDLLSERFGTTGSDGTDESWDAATISGDGAWNPEDQTKSGTGFSGDCLTASYTSGSAYAAVDLGSAYTTLYARIYFQVNSDSWSDGNSETLIAFSKDGTGYSSDYVAITLKQVATDQLNLAIKLGGAEYGDVNITTGTVYKIEAEIIDNGASDEARVWVGGTLEAERTGDIATFNGTGVKDVVVGLSYHTSAISVSFDTLDIDSTGRLVD